MLERVAHTSRHAMEQMTPDQNVALISIITLGTQPAWIKPGWFDSLRLEFCDTNPDPVEDVDFKLWLMQCYPPMHEVHARAVVAFTEQVEQRGATGILVHCEQGISRSAAVAKWIADSRELPLDGLNTKRHNEYVYRLLKEVKQWQESTR